MVRIINYKTRTKEDGTEFCLLVVQGGIEMIKSKTTGQYYATAKKATISTTFDEETCKNLIGTDFPGKIEKINTEPYSYTIPNTGEMITLEHRYIYPPRRCRTRGRKIGNSARRSLCVNPLTPIKSII